MTTGRQLRRHLRTAGPWHPGDPALGRRPRCRRQHHKLRQGLRTGSHWHRARCPGWLAWTPTSWATEAIMATYDYLTYVGAHLSFVGQLKTRPGQRQQRQRVGTASSKRRRALHHRKHDRGRRLPKRQRCQPAITQLARTGATSHLGLMLGGVVVLGAWRRRRATPGQPVSPSRLLCPTASATARRRCAAAGAASGCQGAATSRASAAWPDHRGPRTSPAPVGHAAGAGGAGRAALAAEV